MKKIIIIIVLLIIGFGIFLILNKKENVERCLIAYMDNDNKIQQTYVYDITYSGVFDKKISKINTTKKIISFKSNENITNKYYNDYKDEGEMLKKHFSQYNYELNLEKEKNINVIFKSNFSLEKENIKNLSLTEYKETLDSKGNIKFDKIKKYYKNQGATCKNIKNFK
ncbi:MAG: hypothetical protein RR325_01245 [Bacilli bacterium]